MKIYAVKNGTVISTDIIRETKCYYYIADIKFSWRSRIEKCNAAKSPKRAIEVELQVALNAYNLRKRSLDKAEKRLNFIKKLQKGE